MCATVPYEWQRNQLDSINFLEECICNVQTEWTPEELETLKELAQRDDLTWEQRGEMMGRSKGSIQVKYQRITKGRPSWAKK